MLDFLALGKVIATHVANTTGITVIIANQNAPKPSEPYATIFVTPSSKLGYDRVTYENNPFDPDLTETIEGQRELLASINFYKGDALGNASNYSTQLQSTLSTQYFKANNIGFAGLSDIRDLSEIDKQLWQPRAQIDLTFYAQSKFSELVTSIASVNVNGVVESGSKQTTVNINISEG